jgi:hypothetical protein
VRRLLESQSVGKQILRVVNLIRLLIAARDVYSGCIAFSMWQ